MKKTLSSGIVAVMAAVGTLSLSGSAQAVVEAVGGDLTNSVGNYRIHIFTNSVLTGSLFVAGGEISCDVLIVGGGGGGGGGINGTVYYYGGGGGQVLSVKGMLLATGVHTVVVGRGGTGVGNGTAPNGTGMSSSFTGYTAVGGGTPVVESGIGGSSGSGKAGGAKNGTAAGGGGGDSAVGQAAPASATGGAGGAGTSSALSGPTVYYGGGGGGTAFTTYGAGGLGGGGAGLVAGAANTGGGGGGGADGGSGIVIVRYLAVPLPPPSNLVVWASGPLASLQWSDTGGGMAPYTIERSTGGGAYQTIATLQPGAVGYLDHVSRSVTNTWRVTVGSGAMAGQASVTLGPGVSTSNSLPEDAFANIRDYGAMWWVDGVRSASRIWRIKTSRYALSFTADSLTPTSIFPLSSYVPEAEALVETEAQAFPGSVPAAGLVCKLGSAGTTNTIVACSANNDDSQLVESGRFYQRRWQKIKTNAGPALNSTQSGLETCSWPDRVSFVYRVVPASGVTAGALDLTLSLGAAYSNLLTNGTAQALVAADGSGYIFSRSAGSGSITVNPGAATVTVHTEGGTWGGGVERSVGVIIYPASNVSNDITAAVAAESLAMVNALQVVPTTNTVSLTYDADRGHYDVSLRSDAAGDNSDRLERTQISVSNDLPVPRVVRFAFTKSPQYPAGVTCLMRDIDGNPVGIPVQLSKNWHTATGDRWQGPWFHGLTMLTVPANRTVSFEILLAGQNYGGLPAASHSQLCLVGWGGNQQWDEAAIGCWGENLCYDPESDLASAIGTDSRPLLLLNSSGQQKQWTGNYGGCDFIRYYDGGNVRRYQKRIRTKYSSYGPGLTDVTYAGQTDDSKIEFTYGASLYRSSDYTRGLHRIRYDVKTDAAFMRMVFFQMASDNYNYNGGSSQAYGYGDQLAAVAQWTTNISSPVELIGPRPWFSTINCPVDSSVPSLCGVSRGFIIRSWRARINGQDGVKPHFVTSGSRFDIVPPPGVATLKAGDYVEAEIERVYFGQSAAGYYGGDTNYAAALSAYGNTHSLVLREAIGNNIAASITVGQLESAYPIRVRATNNLAVLAVKGGVGYVPITLTGLTDYRTPLLEECVKGTWTAINQAVYGKDFWQANINPGDGTWELTFNVKLDGAYQNVSQMLSSPQVRTFRFSNAASLPFPAVTDGYMVWSLGITNNLAGTTDCPLGDGYPNLLKYATGSSPVVRDGLADLGGMVSNGLFWMGFNLNTNATDVSFVIDMTTNLLDAGWTGVASNIHASGWTPAGVVEEAGIGMINPVRVCVKSEPGQQTGFMRLRVIYP